MDSVNVSVITAAHEAENQALTALNLCGALTMAHVTTPGNRQALCNFITQVIEALQRSDLDQARLKLAQAIERTDGCPVQGSPHGNGPGRDWVTDCTAQGPLYTALKAALDALTH